MEKCLCRQVFPQTHKNNCVLFKASSPQKLFQHGGEEMPHFRSEFREPCFTPGVFPKSLFTFLSYSKHNACSENSKFNWSFIYHTKRYQGFSWVQDCRRLDHRLWLPWACILISAEEVAPRGHRRHAPAHGMNGPHAVKHGETATPALHSVQQPLRISNRPTPRLPASNTATSLYLSYIPRFSGRVYLQERVSAAKQQF